MGLYRIYDGEKCGYIDRAGKVVVNPQFSVCDEFSENLAAVSIGDKTGFVNTNGKFTINPQFDSASKFGYIDKNGKFVINPQFESAQEFSEGLAAVWIGANETQKVGFVDKSGKISRHYRK